MSLRYRAIRLIAIVAARYGTGSGSDRALLNRALPRPVPKRSFQYIQLKSALNSQTQRRSATRKANDK
jgi:hypothetical protein